MNLERWFYTLSAIFIIFVNSYVVMSCRDCESIGGVFVKTLGGWYTCIEVKEKK